MMDSKSPVVLLVCGGRDYTNRKVVFDALDQWNVELLIHGGATGADALADQWAKEREVNTLRVPAKWKKIGGKQAGPIRNKEMAAMKPDVLVAFPGGTGTANMIAVATEKRIPVVQIQEPR